MGCRPWQATPQEAQQIILQLIFSSLYFKLFARFIFERLCGKGNAGKSGGVAALLPLTDSVALPLSAEEKQGPYSFGQVRPGDAAMTID